MAHISRGQAVYHGSKLVRLTAPAGRSQPHPCFPRVGLLYASCTYRHAGIELASGAWLDRLTL